MDAKRQLLRERRLLESVELSTFGSRMDNGTKEVRAKIWEKAEKADQPENRMSRLLERFQH